MILVTAPDSIAQDRSIQSWPTIDQSAGEAGTLPMMARRMCRNPGLTPRTARDTDAAPPR